MKDDIEFLRGLSKCADKEQMMRYIQERENETKPVTNAGYVDDVESQLKAAIAAINKIAEGGHTWMCPYCKNALRIYSGMCDCALGTGTCRQPYDKFEWRGGILGDSYYEN